MKTALEWLNEVVETVAKSVAAVSTGRHPGKAVERVIQRIQADALRYADWQTRDDLTREADELERWKPE